MKVLRPKRNFMLVVFLIKFCEFWDPKGKLKVRKKNCILFHQSKGERGVGGNCGQLCIFGASIINLIKLFTKNPGEKWQLATQANLAFFNSSSLFFLFNFIFSLVLFSSFVYTIYLLQVLVVAVLLLLLLCSLLLLLLLLLFFPLVVVVVVVFSLQLFLV